MISQRHGIEAICFFLTLDREKLLDLVVECGLNTPHDGPMRRASGSKAWLPTDYAILVSAWFSSWKVTSIAERVGRSASGVYRQARRLGLPKRTRSILFRPQGTQLDLPLPLNLPPLTSSQLLDRNKARSSWLVANSATRIEVRWKRRGREIQWTQEMSHELAMRHWANQRNECIAQDFGISVGALNSQIWRLELPTLPRKFSRADFDPAVAAANIQSFRYKETPCKYSQFTFWHHRMSRPTSRRDKTSPHASCGLDEYDLSGFDLCSLGLD